MLQGSTISGVWTSQRPTGNERTRTVPRRHGCTETPEPPFANKAAIFSTLCVWIVVSAPFLRWPETDRLSQHRAELHNASVDEASKLEETRNKSFAALQNIFASFPCISAAVLPLPDTDRPERRLLACLHFLRNLALLFMLHRETSDGLETKKCALFSSQLFEGCIRKFSSACRCCIF
jgi:uncharacterized MAPEG superfamily protein